MRDATLDGLPVVRVAPLPADPSYARILVYWAAITGALAGIRDGFDVLHVHTAAFHQAGAIAAARVLGRPVLVRSSLSGEFAMLGASPSGRAQKRLFTLADAFVVLSERLATEYREAGLPPDRLNLVPNGVDTDRYRPRSPEEKAVLRDELDLPLDDRILVFHGVFIERKSLLWLVDVLEPELDELGMTLLFVGGPARDDEGAGGYAARLEERARGSPAAGRILVRGFDPEVERYLGAADGYVLASLAEGLPNALLEAMASGLVPFVTRTSGSEDVIEDRRSGFLFEPRDGSGLLEALRAVFGSEPSHDPVALAAAARRRAVDRFGIDAVARSYVEIYSGLLE